MKNLKELNIKNLAFRQKVRYLLIGAGLMVVVAYFLAFQKTFRVYFENRALQQQLQKIENAPEQIKVYEQQLAGLNSRLQPFEKADSFSHENLLEMTASLCEKYDLVIRNFPSAMTLERNEYTIQTDVIQVQGAFTHLVKLVYYFEQEERVGRVASLQFEKRKDHRTKRNYLIATIYLQNIKK